MVHERATERGVWAPHRTGVETLQSTVNKYAQPLKKYYHSCFHERCLLATITVPYTLLDQVKCKTKKGKLFFSPVRDWIILYLF